MANQSAKRYFLPRASAPTAQLRRTLMDIYNRMYDMLGDRRWWPAESEEEMIIGAILVQNVAWSNTAKAIENLRASGLLSFRRLYEADIERVETCIVPTLFYRMKARKLKAFAAAVMERYAGNLSEMLARPMDELRAELLSIHGIGPETADDILLYAAGHPSFVIDAYTKRIFHRLGFVDETIPYDVLRGWFMTVLPSDTALFNQYHALLDGVGHHFCRRRQPRCGDCPLSAVCAFNARADQSRARSQENGAETGAN